MLNSSTKIIIVEENGIVIRNTNLREYVENSSHSSREFVIVDDESKIDKALESLKSDKRITEIQNLINSLSFIHNPDGCSNDDIREAAELIYTDYLSQFTVENLKREVTKILEKLAYKVANKYVANRGSFGCETGIFTMAREVCRGLTKNSFIFMPVIDRDGLTLKFFSMGVAKAYLCEFQGKKALDKFRVVNSVANKFLMGAAEIIYASLNESVVPPDIRKLYMELKYGETILEKWKEVREEQDCTEEKEAVEETDPEYEEENEEDDQCEEEEDEQYDDL